MLYRFWRSLWQHDTSAHLRGYYSPIRFLRFATTSVVMAFVESMQMLVNIWPSLVGSSHDGFLSSGAKVSIRPSFVGSATTTFACHLLPEGIVLKYHVASSDQAFTDWVGPVVEECYR